MFNNSTTHEKINDINKDWAPGREPLGERPSVPLSKAHIRTRERIIYMEGARLLKTTKGKDCERKGGGKRGKIKGYSRQSRYRMMKFFATIRKDAPLPSFVTLTYPDRFPTCEQAKKDKHWFEVRFKRKFPKAFLVWKMEPQKRGAPHFHCLVWYVDRDLLFSWVLENWYEIAGQGDINHKKFHAGLLPGSVPCVAKVNSWRGVWAYASKYLGKTFEVAGWSEQWTGRYWGVIGKENAPLGKEVSIDSDFKEVVQLMRFQRKFSGIKRGSLNSLSIFCDADQWINRLVLERRYQDENKTHKERYSTGRKSSDYKNRKHPSENH